ncbi:ribbon-helix-helix protein, CopG family [Paracoccus sp. YIM 132242]|uniref:Ribbon-helix-helix protein, CopG family n=1 Tax=Paracoccus lichenicola TaxID=2665644 RepID=A0A6L6HVP9_9RHOB|nr:ribbon-helix-helix protein, CopG family [Paracoccus lichenicola]MTE02095.1 ribbon-helix-helix protein, CopG family [Paracoccus lichenicola]
MEKKATVGRPRSDTEPVTLRLPRELIEAIDNRRRVESDLPTRPEMIRRALVQWLELTDPPERE